MDISLKGSCGFYPLVSFPMPRFWFSNVNCRCAQVDVSGDLTLVLELLRWDHLTIISHNVAVLCGVKRSYRRKAPRIPRVEKPSKVRNVLVSSNHLQELGKNGGKSVFKLSADLV